MTHYQLMGLLATAATLAVQSAHGQDDGQPAEVEEIVVVGSGSRLPDSIETYPGSVTIIDQEELAAILEIDNDLGAILGKHVPGFGTGGGKTSGTNFDHTLRGRKPTVLLDGVPITTPLRDGAQDFRSVHPSVLGGIEIIRGATALYGNGGSGGVINYITKRPGGEELSFVTEADVDFSMTHLGDSISPSLMQGISGRSGELDFIVNAQWESVDSFFDADGNRIPSDPHEEGGTAESTGRDFFAKVGGDFGNHRIEVMGNVYRRKQDATYLKVDGDVSAGIPTSVVEGEDPRAADQGIENTVVSANYSHADVLGSTVRLQGFYQDSENIFGFFDSFPDGGGQPFIYSTKYGARLDISTPFDGFDGGADVLWGIDYLNDETGQDLLDGRLYAPGIEMSTIAAFAQFKLPITERLVLRGGVRHESITLDVPDFTTLFSEVDIVGGELDYDATPVNIGAVVNLTDHFDFVASYSEGFSVAEVGRLLRQQDLPGNVQNLDLEASVIDNYEAGFRGTWDSWGFQIAFYENRSNLGTRVSFNADSGQFEIALAPERVRGVELTVGGSPNERLRWNATASFIEGRETTPERTPLSGRSIPPEKFTGYVEYDVSEDWRVRVQGLFSGSRNEFPGSTEFGEAKIDSFQVIDLSTSYTFEFLKVTLAIENLLNEDYFPNLSQLQNLDCCISKAPGRTGSLTFTFVY